MNFESRSIEVDMPSDNCCVSFVDDADDAEKSVMSNYCTLYDNSNSSSNSSEKSDKSKSVRAHVCWCCLKNFTHESLLKKHMRFHDPLLRKISCEKCSLIFVTKRSYNNHLKSDHNIVSKPDNNNNNVKIENQQSVSRSDSIQEYSFNNDNNVLERSGLDEELQMHFKIEQNDSEEELSISDITIVETEDDANDIKGTESTDVDNKNLLDDNFIYPKEATRSAASTPVLSSCISSRSSSKQRVRKCQCSECLKWFSNLSDVVRHMRTHSRTRTYMPERSHRCVACGKVYSSKSLLACHLTTHLPPANRCNWCGQHFIRKASLIKHTKCHHSTTGSSLPEANMQSFCDNTLTELYSS